MRITCKPNRPQLLALSAVIAGLTATPHALSQGSGERIEEITVTARFKEESIQDIGGGVSALGGENLRQRGISDFDDIVGQVAGLNVIDSGPNANDVSMRGISRATNGVEVSLGTAALVSIYMDDIPVSTYGATQKDFSSFDIGRVEILRGPQPTLFGEGAVGGVIRYFSNEPKLEGTDFRFGQEVSFTQDGGTNLQTDVAGEITLIEDVLGVRGSLYYTDNDGFIDNSLTGEEDTNSYTDVGGNLTVLYLPSENMTVKGFMRFAQDKLDDAWFVDGPVAGPDTLANTNPFSGEFEDEFDMYGLKLEYNADYGTYTSITSKVKRTRDTFYWDPQNDVFNPFIGSLAVPSVDVPDRTLLVTAEIDSEETVFTQEFRFVSDFDGAFNFSAGLFFKDAEFENVQFVEDFGEGLNGPIISEILGGPYDLIVKNVRSQDREQYSAFFEGTYDFSEKLTLIAGVRYVNEELTMPDQIDDPELSSPFGDFINDPSGGNEFDLDTFLPRVAVEYAVNEDLLVYGSFSIGVRNGGLNTPVAANFGFNNQGRTPAEILVFDEDEVTSYELGFRSTFADGLGVFNAAAFFSDYEAPLITDQNPFLFVDNAPDAEARGFEFETSYSFNENISAYATYAYTETEFVEDSQYYPAQPVLKGNPMAGIPEHQWAVGVDTNQTLSSGWELLGHASYSFTDERYSNSSGNDNRLMGELGLLNLKLTLTSDSGYSFGIFVDNALNDVESTGYYSLGSDAAGESDPTASIPSMPRVFGVRFGLDL